MIDLDFWRHRGWMIPDYFKLNNQDSIDYTSQYILTLPIQETISDKRMFLLNEVVPFLTKQLKAELQKESIGQLYVLDHIRFHLGEILEDEYFIPKTAGKKVIKCQSCKSKAPTEFNLCWFCGKTLQKKSDMQNFANIFIELTASLLLEDLLEYQFDDGPLQLKESSWIDINRNYYVELSNLPKSEFKVTQFEDNDLILETENIQIFVRFNPKGIRN